MRASFLDILALLERIGQQLDRAPLWLDLLLIGVLVSLAVMIRWYAPWRGLLDLFCSFAYGRGLVWPSARRYARKWLLERADACAADFERLGFLNASEHTFYIPAPISVGGATHTRASDSALAPLFNAPPRPILITGEGGTGKTSLAVQICRWAVAPGTAISRTQRRLPVVIRPTDPLDAPFTAVIERRLREAYELPGSPWLVKALLEEGLVLIVADDILERPVAERQAIYAGVIELRNTFLIATSRKDDELLDVRQLVETLDIPPEHTSAFVADYLKAAGPSSLSPQTAELAAKALIVLTNERPANAFLVKLYCDQLIANGFDADAASATALIQGYLRRVIRHHIAQEPAAEDAVYRACKAIARESLRKNRFSPGPLHACAAIFEALEDGASLRKLCAMRLLVASQDEAARVEFASKTFALYAAAIAYVEDVSLQPSGWQALLKACRETSLRPEEFLTALSIASRAAPGLHPDIRRAIAAAAGVESGETGQRICGTGFVIAGRLSSSPQRAPNGVLYQLYDVRKESDASERALAKCYELGAADRAALEEMRLRASRHAEVCELSGRATPHVHRYLTTAYDADRRRLWVIQEWLDGRSLAALDLSKVRAHHRAIMRDVGRGLSALHASGVIVRTLSPESVYIDRCSGAAVLTNFEMARILGAKSVSANTVLTENPFASPELVFDPSLIGWPPEEQRKVDVYSWGALYVYLLTGKPPSVLGETDLADTQVPASTQALLQRCLEPVSRRPASIDDVLAALSR